jgi:hypothetical protein
MAPASSRLSVRHSPALGADCGRECTLGRIRMVAFGDAFAFEKKKRGRRDPTCGVGLCFRLDVRQALSRRRPD